MKNENSLLSFLSFANNPKCNNDYRKGFQFGIWTTECKNQVCEFFFCNHIMEGIFSWRRTINSSSVRVQPHSKNLFWFYFSHNIGDSKNSVHKIKIRRLLFKINCLQHRWSWRLHLHETLSQSIILQKIGINSNLFSSDNQCYELTFQILWGTHSRKYQNLHALNFWWWNVLGHINKSYWNS